MIEARDEKRLLRPQDQLARVSRDHIAIVGKAGAEEMIGTALEEQKATAALTRCSWTRRRKPSACWSARMSSIRRQPTIWRRCKPWRAQRCRWSRSGAWLDTWPS